MPKPLQPIERRVLGVLIEKALATPAYYPLTVNAIVAGADQKNNRDPQMDVSEPEVVQALDGLRQQGLALTTYIEGARSEKWKTLVREVYAIASDKALAVLSELLLRGPQTKAELRTHASRMSAMEAPEIDQIIDDFLGRPEPLAVRLGRLPGGRAERFAHNLYPEEELQALKAGAVPAGAAPAHAPAELAPGALEKLEEALRQVAALEGRVAALERALEEMRAAR